MEDRMKEALFYRKIREKGKESKNVMCELCPNFCFLKDGETGKCRVRKNINGKLFSLSYGKPVSIAIDPISKKPLYHFLENTKTFSVGMAGCNLSCKWCQNWEISQNPTEKFVVEEISPDKLIEEALKSNCPSISYTYTEPFVSYEYVYDCCVLARKKGLKNILVTNGYVNKEPFEKISKFIDAMNIDLKSFNNKTYEKFCGGKLLPVFEIIKRAHKKGIHIEITTLIVPGVNDSEKELKKIAKFIFSIDNKGDIPWHISRFFPRYNMVDRGPTPIETLEMAYDIGKKAKLKYVHMGNV